MKDKNLAAILAFFFGIFGVHRFYLGQVGLGILYCMFFWLFGITAIIGLIDAIVILSMDRDEFDYKYNRRFLHPEQGGYDTDFDRRRNRYERYRSRDERRAERYRRREARRKQPPKPKERVVPAAPRNNPFKKSGIAKYRDYDYDGAIEDFNKALSIAPRDVAVHFNLACAYSLTEQKEDAFLHLSKAVEYGFVDYKKIQEHDALAYLRIQDEFEIFKDNGYRLDIAAETPPPPPVSDEKKELIDKNMDLLEQIKKLGELRDKGLLTDAEFEAQKRKLLD